MNSVAGGMRKTNLRANLGLGGVDMPSMRSTVNDNVGFEIEDTATTDKIDRGKPDKKAVGFVTTNEIINEKDTKNREDLIQNGRRFSSRFPSSRSRVSDS